MVPNAVKGITVAAAIPVNVITDTGAEAQLWQNGIFEVRSRWMTRTWLHMDSMNHPA